MRIKINGVQNELQNEMNLESLLLEQKQLPKYYVVAVNYNCIPAQDYSQTQLKEGDEVEIVSPMEGG